MTFYYDAFGQPTTTLLNMDGNGRYVSYLHDEAGNRVRITHPDGAAFGYGFDALGRMTSVLDNPAFASADDLVIRYWYKPEGPRHAAVRGAGSAGFTTIFYYDALQRPEAIHNDLPPDGADVSFTFGYNRAGQIVSRTVSNDSYATPPAADVVRGYQVNGLNQYTGMTWDGAPNWSFEHDPNGNLERSIDPAGADSTSFVYDVENRLVSASGKANATLVYDPLGRLFEVTGALGAKTQFLYDGDRMIAEYDGWGALQRRYVHGPGTDEPVAVYGGAALGLTGRRYMLPDERGSVVALIDAAGSSAARNRYDPWGVPPMSSAGPTNEGRFQYTGQAWIAELGLYYYKARFYSPFLGRFMQTDPIGYEGGVNLYAYVGNDPVNAIDPTGESCVPQRDGTSICDPPGEDIGQFSIPAKENPGYIGPEAGGHHVYNAEASTPYASEGLTESITQEVVNNPTPGNDQPATAGGARNDAGISPGWGRLGDQVNSYVTTDSNGNTVVVNVTVPGEHLLNPGYVAQAIIPSEGSTRIVVVGEGNARIQVGPGAALGGAVFQQKIQADMRRGIFNAVRNKKW